LNRIIRYFKGNACDELWMAPVKMSSGPTQCVNVYDVRLYETVCSNSIWPPGEYYSYLHLLLFFFSFSYITHCTFWSVYCI
jgi:hypothetical protein